MALGFGALRLSAAAFWALTPRELAAAAAGQASGQGPGHGVPPRRATLDALIARYPDTEERKPGNDRQLR